MTDLEERIRKAKENAKRKAKELFKEKPDYVKKEFENETSMGRPENLIKPDNKDE